MIAQCFKICSPFPVPHFHHTEHHSIDYSASSQLEGSQFSPSWEASSSNIGFSLFYALSLGKLRLYLNPFSFNQDIFFDNQHSPYCFSLIELSGCIAFLSVHILGQYCNR
jgi:hypothetical protein